MAKKCWFVNNVNCIGGPGTGYFCAESIVYISSGGNCGSGYFVSADMGWDINNCSQRSGSVEQVACSFCSGCCTDITEYDCVNGVCVTKITYGTPGTYKSLAECSATCGVCPACPDPPPCPIVICNPCPDPPPCPPCPDIVCDPCPPCAPCDPCPSICPDGQSCQPKSGEEVEFTSISVPYFYECDAQGDPKNLYTSVSVISGTQASEEFKFRQLADIQGQIACYQDVGVCPEGWLIRPEWHRPQVIYQFAPVGKNGTIIGPPNYKITVPHHLPTKPDTGLPNYERGNWETIFVLKDNSKVTIHSLDEDNGMMMLDAIKLRIIPNYLLGGYLSKSCLVDTDTEISKITVKNRMAKYYATGTKKQLPDWLVKW